MRRAEAAKQKAQKHKPSEADKFRRFKKIRYPRQRKKQYRIQHRRRQARLDTDDDSDKLCREMPGKALGVLR